MAVDLERLVGRADEWKKTTVAQTKIAIATKNGMSDQPISSGIDPVIGAPTLRPVSSRYLIAK